MECHKIYYGRKNKFHPRNIFTILREEVAQLDSTISVQNQVKIYLSETGRKKKWLAAQLEISPAVLSQWLMGKISFSEKRVHDVLNIINSNS